MGAHIRQLAAARLTKFVAIVDEGMDGMAGREAMDVDGTADGDGKRSNELVSHVSRVCAQESWLAEVLQLFGGVCDAWESKIKVIHLTWPYLRLSHSLALIRNYAQLRHFACEVGLVGLWRFRIFWGWLMKANNNNLVSLERLASSV